MAITQAMCDQFKLDVLGGVHQPGDTYKIALYTSAATLDKTTTAYSSTNEVSGTGYTAGGLTLTGYTRALSGDVAYLDWTTDPQWTVSSLTARGALIYNASRANAAMAVIDFGQDYTDTNGNFTVVLPAPGATAIIRFP